MSRNESSKPVQIAQAGDSVLEVEEPDLVIYRLGGVVEGHQLRTLRVAEGQWNEGKRYLLVLVDISRQMSSTMDARKASTEPALGTHNRAIAICGGNHYVQVLSDLAVRAMRSLTRTEVQVRFFPDEEIGRAWLHAQRAELVSKTS
ncbi:MULTISPECIES: hypothetical protein [Polyangium]|uniref:STAS/SEC14 domain-containing protein n=2 Tax=Polyangium TaxID=55 RepID=A0A4U1JLE3_9BACT|nr:MULTISPECIES: hypothetical protein [Polyangium]MDI1433964.1 hypothetical protein [Polyangium sorediatum]TKD12763.1 hypothetical protein E8A74_03170 [Polyangium fumosum]